MLGKVVVIDLTGGGGLKQRHLGKITSPFLYTHHTHTHTNTEYVPPLEWNLLRVTW